MILSVIEQGQLRGAMIFENQETEQWRINMKNLIQGSFSNYPIKDLDSSYFKILDSEIKYSLYHSAQMTFEIDIKKDN